MNRWRQAKQSAFRLVLPRLIILLIRPAVGALTGRDTAYTIELLPYPGLHLPARSLRTECEGMLLGRAMKATS